MDAPFYLDPCLPELLHPGMTQADTAIIDSDLSCWRGHHPVHAVGIGRACRVHESVVETGPTRKEGKQQVVLGLELRHVRWGRHVHGALGGLLGIVLCLGHQVSQIGLNAAQTLDVLFRGQVVWLAQLLELDLLLGTGRTTLALGLQAIDLLQQVEVDVQQ